MTAMFAIISCMLLVTLIEATVKNKLMAKELDNVREGWKAQSSLADFQVEQAEERGKLEAVKAIEELHKENPQAGYRHAAATFMEICAKCKRSCLHCSREEAAAKKKKKNGTKNT